MSEPQENRGIPETREELVQWLPLVMDRLDRLGLHATARQMNKVTREAGWELAALLEKEMVK